MYSGDDDGSASSSSSSTSKSSKSWTSSKSTPPVVAIDEYDDLPFDFALKDEDQVQSENNGNDDDEAFDALNPSYADMEASGCEDTAADGADDSASFFSSDAMPSPREVTSPSTTSSPSPTIIPHRGCLRRILNPSSFHVGQKNATHGDVQSQHGSRSSSSSSSSNKSKATPSSWPMYAVNVVTEDALLFESNHHHRQQQQQSSYQIMFDRQQYEFCTRLFALLDTESQSAIGPDCIREFVCLHCPVVRKRDEAMIALRGGEEEGIDDSTMTGPIGSPTFDEIWDRTLHSDPRYTASAADTPPAPPTIHRIGIEGWMVFCRLLALAHHQESQRRFASRHLQQMMRHKHGAGATRMNSSEVVVVVDNPPPGPPTPISICALVDVEQERAVSDECVQGWPFCPLPLPELDLDHRLAFASNNIQNSTGIRRQQQRGGVTLEPFSSSREGDFILRSRSENSGTVVRRSYSDFEWLNAILTLHKRPGQGHLCGRILPPFPSKQGRFHKKQSILSKEALHSSGLSDQDGQDISGRAIAAAKSGIGMISSVAKTVWSEYISGSTPTSSLPSSPQSKSKALTSPKQSGSAKAEDVPSVVAHRIERYLNYLLENDAFSTSFPLNAILRASQTGLESAKQTLQDHAKQKKRQRSNIIADSSRDGPHSAASIFSALVSKTSTSLLRLQDDDDTPWIRAAAHVAMALQFHGILETTGHETTSAKIQHASLPKFCNRPAGSWDEEEPGSDKRAGGSKLSQRAGSDSPRSEAFEAGVVNVESDLVNEEDLGGYDMLPSPGPSEEHRVLNAGSTDTGSARLSPTRSRFVYETTTEQLGGIHERRDAVLGSIRVESDIDKLRGIVRSIDHTLGKLHKSSVSILSAQDARNTIQLGLLRDIDSWGDNGAEVISQRALVSGVAALEKYSADIEESNRAMSDDLLWQSSLAASAVAAVGEVRDAVRASHTASRAKSAAFTAAEKAKKAYESCDHSSSKERIQHTQAEASTAQSHAIHATVVEYEANIAKRRSAVSLAQDVKSWNIHRKRELLQTCLRVAKSQQEACRNAADAWENLRNGLIDSSSSSFAKDEANMWTSTINRSQTICTEPITETSAANTQEILAAPEIPAKLDVSGDGEFASNSLSSKILENSSSLQDWESGQQYFSECVAKASDSVSSVAEGFADVCSLKESQHSNAGMDESAGNVYCLAPPHLDEDYFSFQQGNASDVHSYDDENEDKTPASSTHESFHSDNNDESINGQNREADIMSTSMQSLIDGLMAWGDEDGQQKNEETCHGAIMGTGNATQYTNLLG